MLEHRVLLPFKDLLTNIYRKIFSSIKAKYVLTFFLIFILIFSSTSYIFINSQINQLKKEKEESFKTLISTISSIYNSLLITIDIINEDKINIQEQLNELFNSNISDLKAIVLIDKDKKYIYKNYKDDFINNKLLRYEIGNKVSYELLKNFPTGDNFKIENFKNDNKSYEIIYKNIYFKSNEGKLLAGHVMIVFTLENIYKNAFIIFTKSSFISFIAIIFSLIFIYVFSSLLTKRIYIIVNAVKTISQGTFVKIKPKGNDEISLLMKEINKMIDSVRERLLLSKYVSESTLNCIEKATENDITFTGQYKEATLFFSDIRDFVNFTENHSQEEVIYSLNKLLAYQVKIIRAHNGDIDKFIGDQVMAVFTGPHMEKQAFMAAQDIQSGMRNLELGLGIGIGIHKGEALFGNIGTSDRMDSTFIGDSVNIAARLCSSATANEIIVSESVAQTIKENFSIVGPFEITIKGKKKPIIVYKKSFAE